MGPVRPSLAQAARMCASCDPQGWEQVLTTDTRVRRIGYIEQLARGVDRSRARLNPL